MAGRFLLSAMRPFRVHPSGGTSSLSVQGVSLSSVCDCGHHFSQDQDTFAQVVLADLPDGYVEDRGIDSLDAAGAEDQRLQDDLGYGP